MAIKHNKVLIIGANFSGLTAAIQLPNAWDVTVGDPSPHFEGTPSIHEILSGVKAPQGLQLDRATINAGAARGAAAAAQELAETGGAWSAVDH